IASLCVRMTVLSRHMLPPGISRYTCCTSEGMMLRMQRGLFALGAALALLMLLALGCDGGDDSKGATPGLTSEAEATPAIGVTVTVATPATEDEPTSVE